MKFKLILFEVGAHKIFAALLAGVGGEVEDEEKEFLCGSRTRRDEWSSE